MDSCIETSRAVDPARLKSSKVLEGVAPFNVAPIIPESVTTLPGLFAHRANEQPHKIAFSCQTDHQLKTLTYAEAHTTAKCLGSQIYSTFNEGKRTKAPVVAVWLEKGIDLVISILATTYSGATWLPFDPDVPVERAAVCMLDSAATVIIYDEAHRDRIRDLEGRLAPALAATDGKSLQLVNFIDLLAASKSAAIAPRPFTWAIEPTPRDAAYLIYTSGTTGTPKGIAIPHSAALIFSLSEREVLQTSPDDIVWNGFSPAFDMFVEEMWVTIAGGGHLAVGTREECQDVAGLPAIWKSRGVSIVNAVPTLMGIMGITQNGSDADLLPKSLRLINLGGEACPPALVDRLARPGLRIVNTYGPTETTVTATWDELRPGVPVTIGRPLPSYHVCVLPISEEGSPVPLEPLELFEGVEGELAIGGPCVALGYVGREDLTQKFIRHPLAPNSEERLYRTGDRVKLQTDLKIVFLGRIDTQVKHRGFRIELGEIESRLNSHPDAQASAVILANAGSDTARLEAFIVVRPGAAQDTASFHTLALQHLPAYMRPEHIYFLTPDEMPRLPSGKINAKALHDVSSQRAVELATSMYVASESVGSITDVEDGGPLDIFMRTLASVFPHAGAINIHADFFDDLGGHSLLAAQLVSRLRQARDADNTMPFASIGLPDIYQGRSPANIAARFCAQEGDDERSITLAGSDISDEVEGTGPNTGETWSVSQRKFIICGIAQIIPLLFFFFVLSIEVLVPYLLFLVPLDDSHSIGLAILAAYGIFVAIPPCLTLLAIAGKWLVLGKAREGEYPLYGIYYFRWWLAERFVALANPKLIGESSLYPGFLRAMGARVGKYCHLGAMEIGAACDLVDVGDDVVIGADVILGVSVVERGRLILKKVVIKNDVIIGSHSVIEGGSIIEEGAEVGPLSLVADGMHIPSFQRWHGSPARFERELKAGEAALGRVSRPSTARAIAMAVGHTLIVVLVIPLLYLVPQIPGLLLFDVVQIQLLGPWGQVAVLSLPIALAYQLLIFIQLIVFRRLFMGNLEEGKFNIHTVWYLRKWFVGRLMDLALTVLHPVFATLYIVPFLRALGVRIGKRAEISTARGLNFELLEIGDESFVADLVLVGNSDVRGNTLTLEKTKLESRAFAGNVSLLPQGTTLPSGSLVGVLSIAPGKDKPLTKNSSCFGSPPVLMPARHRAEGHAEELLFKPSRRRVAARLTIEGLRIVLPRAVLIFGLGIALQIIESSYRGIGVVYTLMMLPAFYLFLFAIPSLLFAALLKWALIGRYRPSEWPLWSLNVWLSEAVTSTYETITVPLLTSLLVGTPYLAWCLRMFGVKIGSRVTLLSGDITEYDCVSIGDEAMVNQSCGAQTHLFEDRVMKIGKVTLGQRSCIKPYSVCLPGSTVGDCAQLGSLSLQMKGESLPESTAWEGAPVVPRARRRRARKVSRQHSAVSLNQVAWSSSSNKSIDGERKELGIGV